MAAQMIGTGGTGYRYGPPPQAAAGTTSWLTMSGSFGTVQSGSSFSAQVRATNSDGIASYTIAAGSLPPGLSIDTSGVISGTSTIIGTTKIYNFTVRATSGATIPSISDRSFSITLTANSTLLWKPINGSLKVSTLDQPIPANYSITSGSLPPGVTLSLTGLLYGTMTAPGSDTTYTATVTAADPNSSAVVTESYRMVVNA